MSVSEADAVELPTQELRDAALRLYGETPETRKMKLAEMRAEIEKLPPKDRLGDLSDASLIRFLRDRKFDVSRAVKSAVNMARFFLEHPSWTENLDQENFSVFASWIQLLEERDVEGRVIMILRLPHGTQHTDLDILKKEPLKLVRWNIWFLHHLTYNIYVQVYGIIVINAFGTMTQEDTTKLRSIINVNERIAVFRFIANCCPFKLKGVYIFDEPVFFKWLFNIVLYFMSPKLRERFHVCGTDYSRIKEVVPDVKFLPACMGGGVEDEAFDWKASFERFKLSLW